jgi:hypothetical protein
MINKNELRLGNIVNYSDGKGGYFSGTVTAINPNKATVNKESIKYENLYPIKLTEEVLVKYGFGIETKGKLFSPLFDTHAIYLCYEESKDSYYNDLNIFDSVTLLSLHQLQNYIYSLFQEELVK